MLEFVWPVDKQQTFKDILIRTLFCRTKKVRVKCSKKVSTQSSHVHCMVCTVCSLQSAWSAFFGDPAFIDSTICYVIVWEAFFKEIAQTLLPAGCISFKAVVNSSS